MKAEYNSTIKKKGYFTQRFQHFREDICFSTILAGVLGLLVGLMGLIKEGKVIYFLFIPVIWIAAFILFFPIVLLEWEMVILDEIGIKFRGYGKKSRKNFRWEEILKLEIAFERKITQESDDEVGSYESLREKLVINVFLIEGGKQSMDIRVLSSRFNYTKNQTGNAMKELIQKHIKNQTQSLNVAPKFETFKPRSKRKFKYTWLFEREE